MNYVLFQTVISSLLKVSKVCSRRLTGSLGWVPHAPGCMNEQKDKAFRVSSDAYLGLYAIHVLLNLFFLVIPPFPVFALSLG